MSTDQQVFRERALKDKAAILELRQSAAFNNYFARRITQNIERLTQSLKYDAMDANARELVRQQLLLYEEIAKWTSDAEIISCDRIVTG